VCEKSFHQVWPLSLLRVMQASMYKTVLLVLHWQHRADLGTAETHDDASEVLTLFETHRGVSHSLHASANYLKVEDRIVDPQDDTRFLLSPTQ
jgi:hypothetical protein